MVDVASLLVTDRAGGVRFEVHAKPRASRSRVVGVRAGALEVSLAAPPADGAANAELVRVLAEALGVRRSEVALVHGTASRTKLVEVTGLDAREVSARLGRI